MFVRAANPIWFMVDLVGLPLNDEYFAFFLTNTLPYLPQNVYRDPQGTTVWTGDIVEFLPNGTLPDNLYFDPNLVYRIEIRHGNTQSAPLIYEINNFVPENGNSIITGSLSILTAANQVSNGNFSNVFFTPTLLSAPQPSLTITTAGTYEIAPDWELVLTGTGTSILTQIIYSGQAINSSPNAINFALQINNSGWTSAVLRQRFHGNGAIFTGGAVNLSVVARAEVTSELISLSYVPSDSGFPAAVVVNRTLTTGDYQIVSGTVNLSPSINTDLSTVAYVDFVITLPTSGIVDITDVQMVGQNTPIPNGIDLATILPEYQQQTEERNLDHLFHFYADNLLHKPKRSIAVGWNFPLNPWQFTTTTLTTIAAQTAYTADQTILHQEAASQIKIGQNVAMERFNLLVQPVTASTTCRFALIQYVDTATIAPYWGYLLSGFVRARIFTQNSNKVRVKMRLIWRTSIPSAISATEPILSWAVGADPIFGADWTAIAPLNDPAYILPNNYAGDSTSAYEGFSFDSFQMPDDSTADQMLGIVFYTMDNMNSVSGQEDQIAIDSISLIPAQFGSDGAAQTFDEVLRDCQFYYESSYAPFVLPQSVTQLGKRQALTVNTAFTGASPLSAFATMYSFPFASLKRAVPTMQFYSPTSGAANAVDAVLINAGTPSSAAVVYTNFYTAGVPNQKGYNSGEGVTTGISNLVQVPNGKVSSYIAYHFTADARLGV